MNHTMKASILFITYKHEGYVAEAIRSAMAQDYPDLELVVCDDGSPDRTREILENELAKCPSHISVVHASSEKNLGFHKNFNRGLAACTGEVVVAMSGDDISLPSRVSRICREFAEDPACMLACSNWVRIDATGRDLGVRGKHSKDAVFSYASGLQHIYGRAPVCGAVAAYRTILRDRFPPMETGCHAEDNCFWIRALLVGNIHYLSEPLVLWRSHGDNQSNWTRDIDNKHAREMHLRFLLAHQCMWRQWLRDLAHAQTMKLISPCKRETLERTVWIKRESYRLTRLSITPASWKLWFVSVSRLLRLQHSARGVMRAVRRSCRKNLLLRLSAAGREAYWRKYFDAKP
jgi:glycosyltransferase involved in cell wall biosynthesis